MISRWIDWCARNRFLVFTGTLALVLVLAVAVGAGHALQEAGFGRFQSVGGGSGGIRCRGGGGSGVEMAELLREDAGDGFGGSLCADV